MTDHTPYQQKIIRRYYDNQDTIQLDRLSGLVADIYLAEGKARARLWKNVAKALAKLKVPESRITHVVGSDDPGLLAKLLSELLAR
jgi:hypothetical protein